MSFFRADSDWVDFTVSLDKIFLCVLYIIVIQSILTCDILVLTLLRPEPCPLSWAVGTNHVMTPPGPITLWPSRGNILRDWQMCHHIKLQTFTSFYNKQALRSSCELLRLGIGKLYRTAWKLKAVKSCHKHCMPAIGCHKDCMISSACQL